MATTRLCRLCGNPVPPSRPRGQPRTICDREQCRREAHKGYMDAHREQKRQARLSAGEDPVKCQVCGREYLSITWAHLRTHGLTLADYEGRFPGSPVRNPRLVASLSKGAEKKARYKRYPGIEPDDRLKEFLVGSLLGDGSLARNGNSPRARYTEGAKNLPYLHWKAEILRDYFPVHLWARRSRPSELTGRRHLCHFLKTGVHPFLGDWHSLWYGTRKVVPLALLTEHLTSFAFAVWFCDDGCMQKQGAYLYTQAFSTSEVRTLAELLERRFALPASILYRRGNQPFLRFPARVRPAIMDLLASFAPPGMSYKYRGP